MEEKHQSVCEERNFHGLYEKHFLSVRNFIYYKTGSEDEAEDIAQESFIRMWENCKEITFSKAKNFLLTIANRLFLNSYRHEKVKLKFQKRNQPNTSSNQERPDHLMEENEFKTKLETAISELPLGQREVFLMNRIDKMSYQEIAEALEISVKAVEKRMGQGLKSLKEKVSELNLHKF